MLMKKKVRKIENKIQENAEKIDGIGRQIIRIEKSLRKRYKR